jgi:hypothetical protein
MPLIAGTIEQFTGSMADAILTAFLNAWPDAMGAAPAPPVNKQMQLLYVAIAEGVISYLAANKDSFVITTTFDGTNYNSAVTDIPTS